MKKLSILSAIVIAGISLSGCGKTYLDINTPNPNSATNATPELVITNAMTVTASAQVTNQGLTPLQFLSGWMGYWAPSGSYATNNQDVASYYLTTNSANAYWNGAYRNLEDYYYVETSATEQQKPFYIAAAKTMKSLAFAQLVDVFNNIPYSEAFQGTLIITPKYDDGQAIYEDLVKQLDSAVALFQNPLAVAASGSDIMFDGDVEKWIQFANTLKLRLLIRQSQMPGRDAYISGEIAKILANEGGFLDEDAMVNPHYANNAGQQNPLWGYFTTLTNNPTSGGQADYWRAASYAINTLQSYNDPRLFQIYDTIDDKAAGFTYAGSILGSQNNIPGNGTSTLGLGLLKSVDQGAVIISAAESHFLQAEAIVRGYITGDDPKVQFEAGVAASFAYLGADETKLNTYLTQNNPNTNWDKAALQGTAGEIAAIIRQKWISEDGVLPIEAYNDYRRLGLPADIPISISTYRVPADAKVPVRYLYPTSEYTTNSANVNEQGTIDYATDKVFWNQ